jgi:hypothetical protein
MSARQDLNRFHVLGSFGLAAIAGVLTGSWLVFVVVMAILIAISLFTGEIRPRRRN